VYVYRWRERRPDGGTTKRSVEIGPVGKLKTEANAWRAIEHMKIAVNAENPVGHAITFGALVDRYITQVLPLKTRLSTRTFYLPWLNNYIKPRWGDYAVSDVKAFPVFEWLNALPLKRKSKQHIRSLMKQLFKHAMLWELIEVTQNPMTLVELYPGRFDEDVPEKRILTPGEFQTILAGIREPYRTMVMIAGCMGLRVSEIIGLKWGDFDWEKLEVRIERAVVLGAVGRVKTPKSKATMPLDPDLASSVLEFKLRTASTAGPEEWVFPSSQTGEPWNPTHIQSKYIRPAAFKATGHYGIGWHNFRHTFSTLLRSFGTDVKVQQELLRHADIRTTLNIYTRAVSDQKREAASKVVQMVLPKRPA
jgi:integrase